MSEKELELEINSKIIELKNEYNMSDHKIDNIILCAKVRSISKITNGYWEDTYYDKPYKDMCDLILCVGKYKNSLRIINYSCREECFMKVNKHMPYSSIAMLEYNPQRWIYLPEEHQDAVQKIISNADGEYPIEYLQELDRCLDNALYYRRKKDSREKIEADRKEIEIAKCFGDSWKKCFESPEESCRVIYRNRNEFDTCRFGKLENSNEKGFYITIYHEASDYDDWGEYEREEIDIDKWIRIPDCLEDLI